MDQLLVMRSLVAVADTESFASAAEQMRTSASSVSRHVASLEKHLGARLVNRTARSVTLTEFGLHYSVFARRIIREIEEEEQNLAGLSTQITGSLSVICPKWLGALDLGDAIAAFSVRYPEIELRLELGGVQDRAYAFIDEGYDVSFHTRPLRDSQMRLRRISTFPFVLCASPAYLDDHGRPREIAGLAELDCLSHEHESSWRLELGGQSHVHKFSRRPFTTNSYLALVKAAKHGRGVALLPLRLAHAGMVTGELEALFGGAHVQERSLCAVHGPSPQVPKKVGALLDFVTQWFAEHPMPTSGPITDE
ncbi:LysR family transcriptional regulator [Cryptosporangium sp. NPDC048952]|uniref:LysR family transcriptional regulator n=1 Tax=Cryptosporangium sp. NPDC048952 TaxID=3363961 RepID=UPI0037233047